MQTVDKSWRPKDWVNPYYEPKPVSMPNECMWGQDKEYESYEEGADAMLEALKKEGIPVTGLGSFTDAAIQIGSESPWDRFHGYDEEG